MPGVSDESKGGARFRGVPDAPDEIAVEGSAFRAQHRLVPVGREEGPIPMRAPEETIAPVLLTNRIICSILPPKRHP